MNTIVITSNKILEEQFCPTSKSYANRVLILAALTEKSFLIKDLPQSQDVIDLINILKTIGVKFETNNESVTILNSFPACEELSDKTLLLPGSEGGTTIRFLLPLLSLGQNRYVLKLQGEMPNRPISNLIDNLTKNGATITRQEDSISLKGPLAAVGTFEVDCSETTQFASALLHLKLVGSFKYNLLNVGNSKKYITLTESLIQKISQENEVIIPADSSSLGYFLVFGCLSQTIKIKNVLKRDKFQADDYFIDILLELGVEIEWDDGLIIHKHNKFTTGFEIDGSQCIDLVPTLMLLAAFIPFESRIKNIKTLEHKESNRLYEMKKILDTVGVCYTYSFENDEMLIRGKISYSKIEGIKTANDHRMIMISALFLKLLGGGKLQPYKGVKKSFKDFFMIFS